MYSSAADCDTTCSTVTKVRHWGVHTKEVLADIGCDHVERHCDEGTPLDAPCGGCTMWGVHHVGGAPCPDGGGAHHIQLAQVLNPTISESAAFRGQL